VIGDNDAGLGVATGIGWKLWIDGECGECWRLDMGNLGSGITTLLLGGIGWIGFNFFGKPIVTLRDNRRDALQVAERYAYVGLNSSSSETLQLKAISALHDAGNALRAHVRERSVATRIYCWALRYELDKAASALFGLGEAVRGQFSFDEGTRRLTLHVLFVALGSTDHLTADEVAVARAEMRKWHDGNRNLTVGDTYLVPDGGLIDLQFLHRSPPPDIV
jgi:hypothetical protein